MSYKVRLSDNAEEEIKLLQNPIRRRVINALRRLAEEPRAGKPLKWQLRGSWSYRAGSYRIIYEIDDQNRIVSVSSVQHRRHVYQQR
ncbi:type II toxin-antitoxin system RelE/ParE family toxin [bacterium]|nr:type II toxin-antitoxin system RelE/ParE family toxin [bacterium]